MVAEIDATDAALIAHVDDNGVAARARAERAASDRLDCLPGWLLLRLHDNAQAAGSAMHPAMTKAYAGIISEMHRLEESLKEKDPRRRVLRGEINSHQTLMETRSKVAKFLVDVQAHNAEAASLDEAARSESLPVQQSMTWATWYDRSRSLEDGARAVLTGDREHRVVFHDGQGTTPCVRGDDRPFRENTGRSWRAGRFRAPGTGAQTERGAGTRLVAPPR